MSLFKSKYLYIKLIDKTYLRFSILQKIMIIIVIDVFYHNPL